VKLFFWGDGGNDVLGLLPPKAANSQGKFQFITYPSNDYPNAWKSAVDIQDGKWYRVEMTFKPANNGIDISFDGMSQGGGTIRQGMLGHGNGPQIGVYSFDHGRTYGTDSWELHLRDMCLGTASCR